MTPDVYVISSGRHDRLPFDEKQKAHYHFIVREDEVGAYKGVGCVNVYGTKSAAQESGSESNLVNSRNFALDHAFGRGRICVQLDDDLERVRIRNTNTEVSPQEAIDHMVEKFNQCQGVYHMGVSPTTNDYFIKTDFSKNLFMPACMTLTKPTPLRYDERLTLKEDYDYCLQHTTKYGVTLRYHHYLWCFKAKTNDGGCQNYRSSEEEQRCIRIIRRKWGDKVRLLPTRKDEISI